MLHTMNEQELKVDKVIDRAVLDYCLNYGTEGLYNSEDYELFSNMIDEINNTLTDAQKFFIVNYNFMYWESLGYESHAQLMECGMIHLENANEFGYCIWSSDQLSYLNLWIYFHKGILENNDF